MSNEQLIRETLNWCNEIRVERGMKALERLPKGKRWNASSCPCGAACGLEVYMHGAFEPDASMYDPVALTNSAVREFIKRFDAGKIPEQDIEL